MLWPSKYLEKLATSGQYTHCIPMMFWDFGQFLCVQTEGLSEKKQDGSHEPECIHCLGLRVKTSAIGKQTFFFPACQLRVVRFYQSCSPPPPPPLPPHPPPPPRSPDPSGHSRTSTASSRSQWVADRSGHCRTSTATSRSQWALPDLNRDFQIAVGTAGPQREECQKRCQIECQKICQIECQKEC